MSLIAKIRAHCLSYPETREDHPWGHIAFKVKGKVFVIASGEDKDPKISLKLSGDSHRDALELPFAEPTRYGLGKHGWVSFYFTNRPQVPFKAIAAWIDESFHAIAPKKLSKELRAAAEKKPARRRARTTK